MTDNDIRISITKQQLADMPAVIYHGGITVADNRIAAIKALTLLRAESAVGFDTETRPSFRKGKTNNVSLIQIATQSHCYLFRINIIGFIPELRRFIEDSSVIKIGLSLKDDFFVLHKINEFIPESFIDLQEFTKKYFISDNSLQKIYGILFGERISKFQRLSNWEAPELSESQQNYAAIDAWACLKVYRYLSEGKFNPAASPYIVRPEQEPLQLP